MMKKNILMIAILGTAVLIGFSACKRDLTLKSAVATTDGSSYLRVIDISPSFRSIYNKPDSFNIFVNGNKVSGFTPGATLLMTFGSSFPAVTSLNGYFAVPAGLQQIKLSVGGVVTADSIPITNFTKVFQANQYYTMLITDSINSLRDSSQIFLTDTYTQPIVGYFNLRFIHAVLNDTAGKAIDVWSTRTNRNIFTNLKPGAITGYLQYPYNAQLNDTLYVRRYGSTTINLDTLNAVSFSNQRTYTLYYKGDGNINFANNSKKRHLATYVHQ